MPSRLLVEMAGGLSRMDTKKKNILVVCVLVAIAAGIYIMAVMRAMS